MPHLILPNLYANVFATIFCLDRQITMKPLNSEGFQKHVAFLKNNPPRHNVRSGHQKHQHLLHLSEMLPVGLSGEDPDNCRSLIDLQHVGERLKNIKVEEGVSRN